MTPAAWWQLRTSREKLALSVTAMSLLFVMIFMVLEPVVKERQRLSAELPQMRADLAWMKAHSADVKRLRGISESTSDEADHAFSPAKVEEILRAVNMQDQLSHLQPLAEGGINISFNEVVFSELMEFIFRLQDSGHVRVASVRVKKVENKNGLVTAELVLLPGHYP